MIYRQCRNGGKGNKAFRVSFSANLGCGLQLDAASCKFAKLLTEVA